MKKIIDVLKNPVMTVFVWLMAAACYAALCAHAIKNGDAAQIGVMVLFILSIGALALRYKL